MSRLLDEKRQYCESKYHNVACKCYILAEEEFLSIAGKSSYWDGVCEESELNFEGKNICHHHLFHYISQELNTRRG